MDYTPPGATAPEAKVYASAHPQLMQRLWRDPLLLSGFLAVGLMAGFQLAVHLLQPPWIGVVNDWLLAVLAWLELLGLVALSWWFSHTHRPEARTWWLLSMALFCVASRRTLLLTGDPALVLPFLLVHWVSQLLLLLGILGVFLAFLLLPTTPTHEHRGLVRLRVFLDSLLLMSAATLLSWYFLLLPLYLQGGPSLTDRAMNLAHAIAVLGVFFILIVLLTCERRLHLDRLVLGVLSLGVLLVLIGAFWFAALDLHTRHASSAPPDAFWLLGYLFVPLAGLVQFRLAQWGPSPQKAELRRAAVEWQDVLDCLRFMLPFVVPLLASVITIIWAILAPTVGNATLPALIVSAGVLALVIVRQGVIFLEQLRLRRERAADQVRELALCEAQAQMETFVSMASHELKTPLTVMTLHQQQALRRLQRLKPEVLMMPPDVVQVVHRCEQDLLGSEAQLKRQGRLIGELLDVSRIRVGRLDLHLEPGDLQDIVRAVVLDHREAWPERSIHLCLSAQGTVPIEADPDRIGQVVTNYLTNALRYSADDRPVEVGVRVEGQEGHVWVRDQGLGLPREERERIWERFYRVPGIAIQSGSGVGLGIGLYICKTIVEHHQGQVGVESTRGAGSTFWFRLPLAS